MAINYKMIAKLDTEDWASWTVVDTPDNEGILYSGGGTLLNETIHVSGYYLDISDYNYRMMGRLESGEWVSWESEGGPDYVGVYYAGFGILIKETIQIVSKVSNLAPAI